MSVIRGLQGIGAGLTIPSALAFLTTTYPLGPERTFVLFMFGGAGCIGQTSGVLLGGIFDATIGWHWIFFVISKINDCPKSADRRVDPLGVLLFMAGIIMIVYYLSESTTAGWGSAKTLAPLIVGLALLDMFILWERRIKTYCRFSPLITAYYYIVHGVGLTFTHYAVTRLIKFISTKVIILIGWCLMTASANIIAQIVPGSTLISTWMCCQVNVVADANNGDQGVVGAVFNVAMQLGGSIRLAIATIMSQSYEGAGDSPVALMDGYRAAFYAMSAFGGIGAILIAIFDSNRDPIEFSGVISESMKEDQERSTTVIEGSSSDESALEGGKAEVDEIEKKEPKRTAA
ncbi:hypothetical protein EDD11_006916 [Mortierella claussenii]|nr:hypothetical protein EDD11_006916 [Mortierella claussenii]